MNIPVVTIIIILLIQMGNPVNWLMYNIPTYGCLDGFANTTIFKPPYDENKLFDYSMDKRTELRYWH
jgi:hypothetical protein